MTWDLLRDAPRRPTMDGDGGEGGQDLLHVVLSGVVSVHGDHGRYARRPPDLGEALETASGGAEHGPRAARGRHRERHGDGISESLNYHDGLEAGGRLAAE